MKKSVLKIMGWSAVALIIPVLGNTFIDGWSWNWNEFVFAWAFLVVMATTILFLTKRFTKHRLIVGTVVFLVFASIWVILATG